MISPSARCLDEPEPDLQPDIVRGDREAYAKQLGPKAVCHGLPELLAARHEFSEQIAAIDLLDAWHSRDLGAIDKDGVGND